MTGEVGGGVSGVWKREELCNTDVTLRSGSAVSSRRLICFAHATACLSCRGPFLTPIKTCDWLFDSQEVMKDVQLAGRKVQEKRLIPFITPLQCLLGKQLVNDGEEV